MTDPASINSNHVPGVRRMVAGPRGFYPTNPVQLRAKLDQMLGDVTPDIAALPLAIIVPHAGYSYSGPTAARAYALVRGAAFKRVVVLGPSHYERFPGAALLTADAYETPLGLCPVDHEFCRTLLATNTGWASVPRAEEQEHSVEMQIPFLQHVLAPGFKLVTALIHDYRPENCRRLADGLLRALQSDGAAPADTLIVASTDLYHGPGAALAMEVSRRTAQAVATGNPVEVATALESGEAQACGAGPILITLNTAAALTHHHPEILAVTTSHEVSPRSEDYVVGYLSAAIARS
ncbi:AmmeMemoRadiSam system protein B [candidate division BRC1 bacterium HGW-BRC1-1]|jgi:hypothetical protein|nr:MAG: AmmeMemoRadiSam system protein B [candidate division BRC1 bacterium HGW-BRC1-1]